MKSPAKALFALICLSIATTVLASSPLGGTLWVVVVFLVLSGLKARIVLNSYLGLSASPFWSRGFTGFVTLFLIAIVGLYLLSGNL